MSLLSISARPDSSLMGSGPLSFSPKRPSLLRARLRIHKARGPVSHASQRRAMGGVICELRRIPLPRTPLNKGSKR